MKMDLAILGVLSEQDLHGYELKRRLTLTLGTWSTPSFGSLYPALARLEAAEAVRSLTDTHHTQTTHAPLTGSFGAELAAYRRATARAGSEANAGPGGDRPAPGAGSRSRKVYAITDTGRQLFRELLTADESADDRAFSLQLAFARHLSAQERITLLERRRAVLVERLSRARATATSSHRRHDPWASALLDHAAASTEGELQWLESLFARARDEVAAHRFPITESPNQTISGRHAGAKETQ